MRDYLEVENLAWKQDEGQAFGNHPDFPLCCCTTTLTTFSDADGDAVGRVAGQEPPGFLNIGLEQPKRGAFEVHAAEAWSLPIGLEGIYMGFSRSHPPLHGGVSCYVRIYSHEQALERTNK